MDQFSFEAVIDFFAEMPDVHVDDVTALAKFQIPDFIKNLIAIQNFFGVLHEISQQLKFFFSQFDRLPAAHNRVGAFVDFKVVITQDLAFFDEAVA